MTESSDQLVVDLDIDAQGLACPMPLLKAKQGLNQLTSGQRLRLVATDAGSVRDFRSFCELSGNHLLVSECTDNRYVYVIEKA